MKKLLLPLICAMLLALCGGRTAQAFATMPLIDNVSPAEYVEFVNTFLETPTFMRAPTHDLGASRLAGHDVYTSRTQNGTIVQLHAEGENISYLNITFNEDNDDAVHDVSSLSVATYIACDMSESEINAIIDMESVQEGNSFTDSIYCSAAQRMITSRTVLDGTNSTVVLSASPN